MPGSSSSRTELAPGCSIAGFRVERVLGRGRRSVVYEATQERLERRVALKLLPSGTRFRRAAWPEHPRVVSLYAAGECEHGLFVAMRLVRGATLAELRGRPEVRGALAGVAEALDAAHADGIVHGTLTARNVLIDGEGRPFLSDFGFGAADATAGADRHVFAALVAEFLGDGGGSGHVAGPSAAALLRAAPAPPSTRRHRRPALALAVAAIVAAVALVAHLAAGRDGPATPPPLRGTEPLGSALDAAGVRSQDCTGRPPSGASPACTLMQTGLPGRPLVAARDGAVVGWAVRGAGGELALQVIRKRRGRFAVVAASPYQRVADTGVHRLQANLAIRAGDRVGVELTPGAAIGMRTGVAGAAATRFTGPLRAGLRRPDRGRAENEVLVRVDYVPGGVPRLPRALVGAQAVRAPAGRHLARRVVELPGGHVRTVVLAALTDRVVLDLLRGERRIARIDVPDARVPVTLTLSGQAEGRPDPVVSWRAPDGGTVSHRYRITGQTLEAAE